MKTIHNDCLQRESLPQTRHLIALGTVVALPELGALRQ